MNIIISVKCVDFQPVLKENISKRLNDLLKLNYLFKIYLKSCFK